MTKWAGIGLLVLMVGAGACQLLLPERFAVNAPMLTSMFVVGVDAPKNDKDYYGLRYGEFVVPLVKAVQELADRNTLLEMRIDGQQELIDHLHQVTQSQEDLILQITAKLEAIENQQ